MSIYMMNMVIQFSILSKLFINMSLYIVSSASFYYMVINANKLSRLYMNIMYVYMISRAKETISITYKNKIMTFKLTARTILHVNSYENIKISSLSFLRQHYFNRALPCTVLHYGIC